MIEKTRAQILLERVQAGGPSPTDDELYYAMANLGRSLTRPEAVKDDDKKRAGR